MLLRMRNRLLVASLAAILTRDADSTCAGGFEPPPTRLGDNATVNNGVALQDVCISHAGPFHAFVIGDWGGVGDPATPAKNRGELHKGDYEAQQRVALQMSRLALNVSLDYVLNVGDSFYWGGIDVSCGELLQWTSQWATAFNNIYSGPGLAGRPWLGVLGNHDYGGFHYNSGWGQIIAMSWVDQRWRIPAQYWTSRVHYPDFSVDYYFVDSNFIMCQSPEANPGHNMCSLEHNGDPGMDCSSMGGPQSTSQCLSYFTGLWHEQVAWLSEQLEKSTATWRIVVTHVPPKHGDWARLAHKYGIDLILCGHVHYQKVYEQNSEHNPIRPSGMIVSGGGGGITSENIPDEEGNDDQYGFVDLTLSQDHIAVNMFSHGGQLRKRVRIEHCYTGEPGRKTITCLAPHGTSYHSSSASSHGSASNAMPSSNLSNTSTNGTGFVLGFNITQAAAGNVSASFGSAEMLDADKTAAENSSNYQAAANQTGSLQQSSVNQTAATGASRQSSSARSVSPTSTSDIPASAEALLANASQLPASTAEPPASTTAEAVSGGGEVVATSTTQQVPSDSQEEHHDPSLLDRIGGMFHGLLGKSTARQASAEDIPKTNVKDFFKLTFIVITALVGSLACNMVCRTLRSTRRRYYSSLEADFIPSRIQP